MWGSAPFLSSGNCPIGTPHKGVAADQFEELVGSIEREADLRDVLKALGPDWSVEPDTLLSACIQNDDLVGLRRDLDIDLPTFNSAIRELGPPYHEISFAENQTQKFKAFVTSHRDEIQNALRAAFRSAYDAVSDLSDYVAASGLNGLNPDPDWATQYDGLPEHLMLERVNEWLANFAAGPIDSGGSPTGPTVSEYRAANRDALRRVISEGWAVVSSWCRDNERQAPDRWRIRNEAPQSLVTHVQGEGWLDFELLDPLGLIKSLVASGNWPEGMPRTLDPDRLGIDRTSLNAAEEEALQEKAERARLASIVNVGGLQLSADQEDLPDVLTLLIKNYAESGSGLETPAKIVSLEALEPSAKGGGDGRGKKTPWNSSPPDLPEAQKKIIGLLGERFAFEWLKRRYPTMVNEESWVSTNRERALQLPGGNNYLGYDFIVNLPSYTLYFEVKSTSGEDFFFRLGPTEVEAAVRFRTDSKHRYRILLVQNVLSPELTRPLLLPNPFSDQHRDRFKLVTKGEQGFRFLPSG